MTSRRELEEEVKSLERDLAQEREYRREDIASIHRALEHAAWREPESFQQTASACVHVIHELERKRRRPPEPADRDWEKEIRYAIQRAMQRVDAQGQPFYPPTNRWHVDCARGDFDAIQVALGGGAPGPELWSCAGLSVTTIAPAPDMDPGELFARPA